MIFTMLKNIFTVIFIYTIKIYQLTISPIIKTNCRYLPTCSEYAILALREHGTFKGIYLSLKRISHCHPYGGHGYDPVPKKVNKVN